MDGRRRALLAQFLRYAGAGQRLDQENSSEQMIASCRALDRVLLWQYYLIPLYAVDLRRTVHWDKFGIPAFEPKYLPAFPDGWWYDPEKAARIVTID